MGSAYHPRSRVHNPVTVTNGELALHRVLGALEAGDFAPRRNGAGYVAHCPGHDDRNPSLAINEGTDGRALLYCRAGCELERIVGALGLLIADLFTDRPLRASGSPRPPLRSMARETHRPPRAEVADVWRRSRPAHEDPDVAAWLKGRGLEPELIGDRDLARALPPGLPVPGWMCCRGASWPAGGYRVVFGLWNERGELTSLLARNVRPEADPKGAFPAGYAMRGLVLAADAGREMLRTGRLDGPLWICEGAQDFLTVASAWGDAADPAPAVLGVSSGSWTSQLGTRVPNGARVVVACHHDKAGEKYASDIAQTLAGRCLLGRWMPPREVAS